MYGYNQMYMNFYQSDRCIETILNLYSTGEFIYENFLLKHCYRVTSKLNHFNLKTKIL